MARGAGKVAVTAKYPLGSFLVLYFYLFLWMRNIIPPPRHALST
jgi:hypothetical protein